MSHRARRTASGSPGSGRRGCTDRSDGRCGPEPARVLRLPAPADSRAAASLARQRRTGPRPRANRLTCSHCCSPERVSRPAPMNWCVWAGSSPPRNRRSRLSVFRDMRARLADDLGIDPGAAQRTTQQQVLNQAHAVPEKVMPTNLLVGCGRVVVHRRTADHTVALDTARGTYKRFAKSSAVTDFRECSGGTLPDRRPRLARSRRRRTDLAEGAELLELSRAVADDEDFCD